jgi:hypothetical protein
MSDPTVPEESAAPVRWPAVPDSTDDATVDRALDILSGVPDAPVADHAGIYSAVHDFLLEALDAEPGLPPAVHRQPEGGS